MDDTLTAVPSEPSRPVYASEPGRDAYALDYKPVPEAAVATRVLVREALIEWRLAELIDDSALVATELVSNAIRSEDDITVRLSPATTGKVRFLRIEVFDTNPEPPKQRDGDLLDECGKGLQLVAAIAADWGHRPLDNGKIVWAVVGPARTAE